MLAHRVVAGRRVVAPLARLVVCGMNKRAVHDQLTQVGENRCGLGERWRGNAHALALPLMAREVVLGAGHFRPFVSRPQQLYGGQTVERMLKPPTPIEDSLPVVAPVAAGLVINDAELRRTDLVDAIDASGDAERQAAAKIDVDRLGAGELLTLLLTVGNHRSP